MADIASLGFAIDSRPLTVATAALKGMGPAANEAAKGVDNAARRTRTLTQRMSEVYGPVGSLTSRLITLTNSLSAATVGAGGLAIAVGTKAVAAFQKFEEHALTLDAMLKGTGHSAGRTAVQIEEMATSIGNISEVRKAALELIKFGSISKEVFDQTLIAADDLSAAGFGSISSAAEVMGKALVSPADGLTRLRRAGLFFSDAQIAMAKNMQETGRIAEAQQFILDELRKRVGGAGAARDQGLAGSYEALGDATQRLMERWGKQISEGLRLTSMIKGVADAIDVANKKASDPRAASDQRISIAQGSVSAFDGRGGSAAAQGRRRAEAELNAALEERRLLEERLAVATKKSADATADASRAADNAEQHRRIDMIKGLVEALDRETESLKKNAFQRAVDIELRKAEAAGANSPGRADVEKAVNIKMTTEAVEQYTEATKLQSVNQIVAARSMTMGAAGAARYKSEQEQLNLHISKGTTLSIPQRLEIARTAVEAGKAAAAMENANVALENRNRLLGGRQGTEMALLELSLVGKTAEEQERLTGQLRIKHQLEQDAAQRNAKVDPAHLKALQDQVAEQARLNEATRGLNQVKDILEGAASGFVSDLAKGVGLMDNLANSAGRLGKQLIDIGSKQMIGQLMGALSGGAGQTFSGDGSQSSMGGGAGGAAFGAGGAALGAGLSSVAGAIGGPLASMAVGMGLEPAAGKMSTAKDESERSEQAGKDWQQAIAA